MWFRYWDRFRFWLGDLEVREVFSVNGGNTFRVSLDKPRISILNGGRFDNTSNCQINMFKQVERTSACYMFKQVKSELAFTCRGVQCQVQILDSQCNNISLKFSSKWYIISVITFHYKSLKSVITLHSCLNKYTSDAIQRKKHYLIKAYSSIHYRKTLKRAKLYCVKHNVVKA